MNSEKSKLIKELIRGNELSLEEAKSMGQVRNANLNLPFRYSIRGDNFLGEHHYVVKKTAAYIVGSLGDLVAKSKGIQGEDYLHEEAKKHSLLSRKTEDLVKINGFYNVFNHSTKEFKPMIVMKTAKGIPLNKLTIVNQKKFEKANNLRTQKVIQNYEKGIIINDSSLYNVFYDETTNKVEFIDPEFWKFNLIKNLKWRLKKYLSLTKN